jgi:nucleoid-associated protein YgaU
MPTLTFKWGTLTYLVNLTTVNVTYERFTSAGTPIRASADLTFTTTKSPPTSTNPTSGGIPGRSSHTVVAGESLQHIATANYGRPGAWRALAAANGIEDPLAIQPGMIIYVPAPAELGDGGGR